MYSIYHLFKNINERRQNFKFVSSLKKFPFDTSLFSFDSRDAFPNMTIQQNTDNTVFKGGELIELKDSNSYTIPSFDSSIPTGKKNIKKIFNSNITKQAREKKENIYSSSDRDVFYLIRGRKNGNAKVCLIHGSFFETVKVNDLITKSFSYYLDKIDDIDIKCKVNLCLLELFENAKIRKPNINDASVKLLFITEAKVKAEGNILNLKKYPEIKDDTLNFVLPCHNEKEEKEILSKAELVFDLGQFNIFKIKHHFNGYFLVFQVSL